MNKLEEKVNEILDKIRPYLQKDGGDVEFVKIEKDTVYVRVVGACVNCSTFDMTLRNGIELALTSEIPEIKKVINVE
jgi:Fe-S cluster biogenesis protein NfuA